MIPLTRFILVVAVVLSSSCGDKKIKIHTEKAARRNLVEEVSGPARVRSATEVELSADAMGRVVTIGVQEGQHVEKGDFLLQLDPVQYEAQVERARAELEQARANLEQIQAQLRQGREELSRQQRLAERELVSDETLERQTTEVDVLVAQEKAAKRSVERTQALLNAAEDQLQRTTFVSPIDGTVSKINVEEGEMAVVGTMNNPGTMLMQIAALETMEAEVEIDETEVVDIRIAQPALVELDAFPDTALKANVVEISSSAVVKNRGTPQEVTTFPVVVLIDELIDGVRPGMTGTVRIETARKESVLSVAISSLVVRDPDREERKEQGEDEPEVRPDREAHEKEGIYVIEDGKSSFRVLETGILGEQYVEILDGIDEDAEVIIGPFEKLRDLRAGTKVKVVPMEEE